MQITIETLKRLLSPEYWVVAEPGPLGRLWILYLPLGMLFAAGLVWSLRFLIRAGRERRKHTGQTLYWLEMWACLVGLLAVLGRFLGWPGWSARIWPLTCALLALASAALHLLCRHTLPTAIANQVPLLTMGTIAQPLASPANSGRMRKVLGLGIHLGGIAAVLHLRYEQSPWLAFAILPILLSPQAPLLRRRVLPNLLVLAPLLAAYTTALLWQCYRTLGITITGWQGLAFPDPMTSLFYLDGIVLGAVALSMLLQLNLVSQALNQPRSFWRWVVSGLLCATLVWAGMVYFSKRTHGATASDPYAYAQMGVDLAERGTFLHRFALFKDVMPLGIAWAPLQPAGYHIPRNEQGDCPSVWATGASVLLAAAYLLFGEIGLYVATPIEALAALAATWALALELLHGSSKPVRYATGALAVALVATSTEHVDRLLVPMADAAAQLFTVLTLLFALRAMRLAREGKAAWGALLLTGACLAWAYWVRHTQLALVLPVALASLLTAGNSRSGRSTARPRAPAVISALGALALVGIAATVAATPDILYRWKVFGGPLATETTELPLMSARYIGPVAWQMLREALVAGEWGYLFPFALYGGYHLARSRRRESLVLGIALAAVLLVNLTYQSLRLRDLIALFPLIDLAVAYGIVVLAGQIRRATSRVSGRRAALAGEPVMAAGLLLWIVFSLALARWAMIDNLWRPGWASFGYMRPEQRAAFDQIAELTAPASIVAASLNAGAVALYSDREPIRPYDSWTPADWQLFLETMEAAGREVYLLDDGALMAAFIEQEKHTRVLVPMAKLPIPIFYDRSRESGWLYRLEQNTGHGQAQGAGR